MNGRIIGREVHIVVTTFVKCSSVMVKKQVLTMWSIHTEVNLLKLPVQGRVTSTLCIAGLCSSVKFYKTRIYTMNRSEIGLLEVTYGTRANGTIVRPFGRKLGELLKQTTNSGSGHG